MFCKHFSPNTKSEDPKPVYKMLLVEDFVVWFWWMCCFWDGYLLIKNKTRKMQIISIYDYQPPYLPDTTSSDFFLLSKRKIKTILTYVSYFVGKAKYMLIIKNVVLFTTGSWEFCLGMHFFLWLFNVKYDKFYANTKPPITVEIIAKKIFVTLLVFSTRVYDLFYFQETS